MLGNAWTLPQRTPRSSCRVAVPVHLQRHMITRRNDGVDPQDKPVPPVAGFAPFVLREDEIPSCWWLESKPPSGLEALVMFIPQPHRLVTAHCDTDLLIRAKLARVQRASMKRRRPTKQVQHLKPSDGGKRMLTLTPTSTDMALLGRSKVWRQLTFTETGLSRVYRGSNSEAREVSIKEQSDPVRTSIAS